MTMNHPLAIYLWESSFSGRYVCLPSKRNCRWIVPSNQKIATATWDFFLPSNRFSGTLKKNVLKLALQTGILRLLRSNSIDLHVTDESLKLKQLLITIFGREDITLSMSIRRHRTGVIGAVFSSGAEALGIIKLGESRLSKEAEALKTLESIKFHESNSLRVQVPKLLYSGDLNNAYLIVESVPSFHGDYGGADFNLKYAELLRILFEHTACRQSFLDSTFYRSMKKRVIGYPLSHQPLLLRALNCVEDELRGKEIYFGLSHGDFKPRNMLWERERVFVFDWAAMSVEAPFGIDFVHFLFRTAWKEYHKTEKELYDCIMGNDKEGSAAYYLFRKKTGNLMCEPKVIVLLYLIDKFPLYKIERLDKRQKVLIDLLEIALDHFSHIKQ